MVSRIRQLPLNRGEVGHDGKTAYERLKGKPSNIPGVEFGETVMWKRRPVGGPLGKLSIMWEEGVYLGIKGTTSEIIIGAGKGIYKTRSIKRKPEEEKWNVLNIRGGVFGLPWEKTESNLRDNLEQVRVREFTEEEKRILEEKKATEVPKAPLKMTIRIQDIIQHGATVGCAGCRSAIKQSRNRLPHNLNCRSRFENVLKDEDRAKTAKKRSDEYISKVIEADDIKRNPKKAKVEETAVEDPTEAVPERMAEDTPVDSDDDLAEENEGGIQPSDGGEEAGAGRRVRRRTVNLLEGGSRTRDKEDRKVNDDAEEMRWAEILVQAVEGEPWEEESRKIYDDLAGNELNPKNVKAARKGEMEFVKKIQVYEERTIEECWHKTGKRPIPTRWVDILKGDEERSRWVAQDFKGNDKNRDDLFAAMPPLEAKKALLGWQRSA